MAIAAVNSVLNPSGATSQFNATRRAADPFAKTFGSQTTQPATDTDEKRRLADLSFSEFKRNLKQLISAAGIDTSQAIRLESDSSGGVTVVGLHPDRDKIERIFLENPDLAAKFHALAERFTALRAVDKGTDSRMFPPSFGLSIVGDEIDVAFQ